MFTPHIAIRQLESFIYTSSPRFFVSVLKCESSCHMADIFEFPLGSAVADTFCIINTYLPKAECTMLSLLPSFFKPLEDFCYDSLSPRTRCSSTRPQGMFSIQWSHRWPWLNQRSHRTKPKVMNLRKG